MEKMYLADEDGSNSLHLFGSSVCPPVTGSRRQGIPKRLPGGLVEEVIEVALQGAGIQDFVQNLEEKITLSRTRVKDSYLSIQVESPFSPLQARVLDGRVELLGGGLYDRNRKVQTVRLCLVRSGYWEDVSRALYLTNQNGTDVWNGLAIRNHCDSTSGHQNFVDVGPVRVGGAETCPVQVRLILPEGFASTLQDCYIAAGYDLADASGAFEHVLEGEAGSPGGGCTTSSPIADVGCSAGYFERVEWTAQNETALWKWTLDATRLRYMNGRLFRPVLRLAEPPAADIYLRLSVPSQAGFGELLRTQQIRLDPGRLLTALPAVHLPPDWMGGGPYEPLEIQLMAECAAPGVKSLDIDFVQLLPGSSFQHLHPLGGLAAGNTMVSDGRENKVYACQTSSGSQHVSHAMTGSPILVQPGRHNRIYFLFETAAGAPVDALTQVMVYQKARWAQP